MNRGKNKGKQPLLDLLLLRLPEYDRDELYRYVMCAEIKVDGAVITDPRATVSIDSNIQLVSKDFVSRGGEKIAAALDGWSIDPAELVWLDAGASTGGFTDALLQRGATTVHAVDVGYNQLDYRLRVDPRVIVHERTNILDVTHLDPQPDAAVCDLSFRSLRVVLRHILGLTRLGWGVALLKPQFEVAAETRWGRREATTDTDGVVSGDLRSDVIKSTIADLSKEGVSCEKRMESPISGRSGNRELLLYVRLDEGTRQRGGRQN